jgi:hypothetical protein
MEHTWASSASDAWELPMRRIIFLLDLLLLRKSCCGKRWLTMTLLVNYDLQIRIIGMMQSHAAAGYQGFGSFMHDLSVEQMIHMQDFAPPPPFQLQEACFVPPGGCKMMEKMR